jgi:hypothetical protein
MQMRAHAKMIAKYVMASRKVHNATLIKFKPGGTSAGSNVVAGSSVRTAKLNYF